MRLIDSSAATEVAGISSDGRYAVLNTPTGHEAADVDGELDAYRFDAALDSFTRLSAGSAGGNGAYSTTVVPTVPSEDVMRDLPFRGLSEDGSRAFFTTAERLVPEDRNEVADVYEWANGSLGLISGGAGAEPSYLMGSSADGSTVVFETASVLLPSDRDGEDLDYYAARIGGGFPEAPPPGEPCPCDRRSSARQQIDGSPGGDTRSANGRILSARIDAAARRRFVAAGRIALLVELPRAGKLQARARARIGGRTLTIAATEVRVPEAGPVQLSMPLSRRSKRALARGSDLRVELKLRLVGSETRTVKFGLEGVK